MSFNTRGKSTTRTLGGVLHMGTGNTVQRQKKVFSSPDSPTHSIGSPLYESFNKIGIQGKQFHQNRNSKTSFEND
jgi:hypothetical protein